MAIEYGTIAVVPKGEWDSNTQYEVANLVTLDGSSYVAHTEPPVGTLPTNMAYWQVSAQGTSKATADSVGTVKPDGVTTEVNTDGVLSAKIATQSTAGMVKGSPGITVGTGGAIDVNTAFTQATELANIIAGEAIAQVLGKISKSIATTMNLDQNALLKNMLTNMDANDSSKIPTSAFIHTLVERIGMGEDLDIGDNLTAAFNALNSNLVDYITYRDFAFTDLSFTAGTIGTRGYQGTIPSDTLAISGYTPIAFSIVFANDSSQYIPITIYATTSGILYFNLYRATTSSVSGAAVTVRAVYRKSLV